MLMLSMLSSLSGCKVVDAPVDLESLMVYGFVNFDQDSDAYLRETADSLLPVINANYPALTGDGYRVNNLTRADLRSVGVNNDTEDIVGAMGLVDYTHKIDPVVDAASRGDKDKMFPENFVEYEILSQSDRPCFLSHDCDTLDQKVHEVADVAILKEAERTYESAYRRVETDTLGEVTFVRQLSPDPVEFSTNIANVFQQYSFVMLYGEKNHARRIEAFWVDAEFIGMDVPDVTAVNQAVKQMGEQAARIDAWIDAQP
ncbi:MAG: hypothetical protein R3F59_04880 [Myxococcota bacterium]